MLRTGGGKSLIQRLPWRRFVRRQQSYIAIAVAIYAALWAVDRPGRHQQHPHLHSAPVQPDRCGERLPGLSLQPQAQAAFLGDLRRTIFVIAVVGVGVVNAIEYPLSRVPGQTLWQFLRVGWKLPFMATMIVGVSTELYRRTRERLESRNRELQRTIEREAAERVLYGQELEQAREIQQSLLPEGDPAASRVRH